MPYSKAHKEESRRRILENAARLFTHHGFEQVSIDQVMTAAHMTRGAFYAHFSSKAELYAQAMLGAARNSQLMRSRPAQVDDETWLGQLIDGYLSLDHIRSEHGSCPLASLVTDVVSREPEVKYTYTEIFRGMNALIRRRSAPVVDMEDGRILAVTSLMIGAAAVARAVDDEELAGEILASGRRAVRQELGLPA